MARTGKSGREFEHESLQDPESIAKYLEAIEQGFRSGRLLFCSGDRELVLKPHGLLAFAVKAKRRNGRVRITLEVDWKDAAHQENNHRPLSIHVPDQDND